MNHRIQALARSLAPRLVALRRDLHRYPELSGQEVRTTAILRTWLAEAGIPLLPLKLQTGVVAEIQGGRPGPTVALRGDIDALPVTEETDLPYASQVPGTMHACGHDFHTAVAMGATLILQHLAPELPGRVRLLFQPAEETAQGARALMAAGALDGVEMIFGQHNKPDVPAGHVGLREGPLMAGVDNFRIIVEGIGGHAAIPHGTVDPIVAASAIVMALQTVVARNLSPLDAAVVSVGSFQAGSANNVIPPSATLLGTVRTFTPVVRDQTLQALQRIVQQVSAGYGCSAKIRWLHTHPAVTNAKEAVALMRQAAETQGMPVVDAIPTMAGEDFSCYQAKIPGCFIWLGTGQPQEWHHPRFTVDEGVIPQGAALLAQAAWEALRHLTGDPSG